MCFFGRNRICFKVHFKKKKKKDACLFKGCSFQTAVQNQTDSKVCKESSLHKMCWGRDALSAMLLDLLFSIR